MSIIANTQLSTAITAITAITATTAADAMKLRDVAYSAYLMSRCAETFAAYQQAGDLYAKLATAERNKKLLALAR